MHRQVEGGNDPPAGRRLGPTATAVARFRRIYHHERPHEGIDQRQPARLYTTSPRALPTRLAAVEYPGHYEIRRVSAEGGISCHSCGLSVSTVLIGEDVGLEPIDDGLWDLHFGPVRLGRFDERRHRIQPASVLATTMNAGAWKLPDLWRQRTRPQGPWKRTERVFHSYHTLNHRHRYFLMDLLPMSPDIAGRPIPDP